jgi:hypothetical protein
MATGMIRWSFERVRSFSAVGLLLGSVLALGASCGGTTRSGTDSNTHWFERCSDREDCGGLECLCGVCTKVCNTESQCGGLAEAVCEPISSCTGSAQATSVCTAECSGDAECTALGASLTCADGHCESRPGTDQGQAGSAGDGNTSNTGGRPSGGASSGGTGGSSRVAAAGSGAVPSASGGRGDAGAPGTGGTSAAAGGNGSRSGSGGSGNVPAATGGTTGGGEGGSADGGSDAQGGAEPSTGGTPSSGGSTASEAGAGGAPLTGDRLVLDPASLVFFGLPINSNRVAVTGYDASHRTCATLVWQRFAGDSPGPACDVFQTVAGTLDNPYVVLKTDTDGPCTDKDWDYAGSVDTTSSSGCMDFSGAASGGTVNMVDVEIGVEGTAFTGTVVANNRAEGMVTFGLEYISDIPEDVYVQTGGDLGLPEWLHVTKDGAPVDLFDHCDVPKCGTSDGVCGIAFNQAANITGGTQYTGSIYLTWDGQVWSVDEENQCLTSAPAAAGTYQVEVCYGGTALDSGAGPVVQNAGCRTQEFTYPTDRVTVTVNNGG